MSSFEAPQEQEVEERVLYLTGDRFRLLEDEYWAELSTDILMGWKTHQEATAEFMGWRAGYRAVENSGISTPECIIVSSEM